MLELFDEELLNYFENEHKVLEKAEEFVEKYKTSDNELFPILKDLTKNYKKVLKQVNKLVKISDTQQNDLNKTKNELKSLLDNAKQGFLSFSNDMLIHKEYSAECEVILEQKLYNKKLSDILFEHDKEKQENFNIVLSEIFDLSDKNMIEVWFKLLPEEVFYKGKYINMQYTAIAFDEQTGKPTNIMVIMTDITEKRQLEIEMEREKKVLKMVVGYVTNYNEVTKIIDSYKEFCIWLNKVCEGEKTASVNDILREIHTFKGNFGQVNFMHMYEKLAESESELHALLNINPNCSIDCLIREFKLIPSEDWLNDDLSILNGTIGDRFSRQKEREIFIKKKLLEIEEEIKRSFPDSKNSDVVKKIRLLRFEPISELLKYYESYVDRTAERLSKMVKFNLKVVYDTMVDTDKYYSFSKTLVHVFRNALDHGIEDPEERFNSGKSFEGMIRCIVDKEDPYIVLKIIDDGRGINVEKIKEKAVKDGFVSEEQLENMSKDDMLKLIFLENFSTKEEYTDISGLGMGLVAVKNELEKIGGKLKVNSDEGKGTEFCFYVPVIE